MTARLPRPLKKAIKKTFAQELIENNMPVTKKALTFLYKETINFEMNEVMDLPGVITSSDTKAISLGLRNNKKKLSPTKASDNFQFSCN